MHIITIIIYLYYDISFIIQMEIIIEKQTSIFTYLSVDTRQDVSF